MGRGAGGSVPVHASTSLSVYRVFPAVYGEARYCKLELALLHSAYEKHMG